MKILSITAQKPSSTGSGVFLAELVRVFAASISSGPTPPADVSRVSWERIGRLVLSREPESIEEV